MSYKVVIPSAGLGSRLGSITKYIPKALVSIGTKPAISRIIEMFPKDCEFIIPVGYKGELIKEYRNKNNGFKTVEEIMKMANQDMALAAVLNPDRIVAIRKIAEKVLSEKFPDYKR